jgi:hypothetical protein
LLSERVERPRARHASEYRNEFPPPHSITSSATASRVVARSSALRRLERWAIHGPVNLLNRSLPREASGDDPRGGRVGMVRRRPWVEPPPPGARAERSGIDPSEPFAFNGEIDSSRPLIAIPGPGSGHSRRISAMLTTGSSQLVERRLCFFEIWSTGRSAGLAPLRILPA